MSVLETEKRQLAARQIGPTLGQHIHEIQQVIHHSSTRRPEGSTEGSDIDLTVVLNDMFYVISNTGYEILNSTVTQILRPLGYELGTGRMQIHLSAVTDEILKSPEKFTDDQKGLDFIKEIRTKGEVVFDRSWPTPKP